MFELDLKWSLWSRDLPDDLMDLLRSGQRVEIESAPSKEVRFGELAIWRDADSWRGKGTFSVEWDSSPELVPDGLLDDCEAIADLRDYSHNFCVSAPTLEALVEAIDLEEDIMLRVDAANWAQAEEIINRAGQEWLANHPED